MEYSTQEPKLRRARRAWIVYILFPVATTASIGDLNAVLEHRHTRLIAALGFCLAEGSPAEPQNLQ